MLALWNDLSTMDRFFDDVMGSSFRGFGSAAPQTPPVDIRWKDDEVALSLDVPGVKREDLELTLEDRVLTIKGSRKSPADERERPARAVRGTFSVSYTLGDAMDGERLSAELADGVLTIHIPKHAKAQPRRIEVQGHDGPRELSK